jgi:hydroxymethylglutaryl-CoA lyase
MVNMLAEMGIRTGIDLVSLIGAVRAAESSLGVTFAGQLIRAERSCDLHPAPCADPQASPLVNARNVWR